MAIPNENGASNAALNGVAGNTNLVVVGDDEVISTNIPAYIRTVQLTSTANHTLVLPINPIVYQLMQINWSIPGEFSLAITPGDSSEVIFTGYADAGSVAVEWVGSYWAVMTNDALNTAVLTEGRDRCVMMLTLAENFVANNTITIGDFIYTFKATAVGSYDVEIGLTPAATAAALVAAVHANFEDMGGIYDAFLYDSLRGTSIDLPIVAFYGPADLRIVLDATGVSTQLLEAPTFLTEALFWGYDNSGGVPNAPNALVQRLNTAEDTLEDVATAVEDVVGTGLDTLTITSNGIQATDGVSITVGDNVAVGLVAIANGATPSAGQFCIGTGGTIDDTTAENLAHAINALAATSLAGCTATHSGHVATITCVEPISAVATSGDGAKVVVANHTTASRLGTTSDRVLALFGENDLDVEALTDRCNLAFDNVDAGDKFTLDGKEFTFVASDPGAYDITVGISNAATAALVQSKLEIANGGEFAHLSPVVGADNVSVDLVGVRRGINASAADATIVVTCTQPLTHIWGALHYIGNAFLAHVMEA